MDEPVGRHALGPVPRHPLDGVRAPVGPDVGEDLRPVGQQVPSSMVAPFSESFSVANTCGALIPFQSKLELRIASMKSPLGLWSVH